jgi:hypothetical protein
MIDDMALLKQAMEQMDAEDPVVAQAAEERAAQILGDANLSFSKMAELIEQRRLLLRPMIVANIKRMDQPGVLGDAAFRNAGSALRREGQSFRQIAEAIELTGRPGPGYEDPVQQGEPLQQTAIEPGEPAWRRALALVRKIVFFPLRRRILSLTIALIAILVLHALQGFLAIGEHVLGSIAAVRHSADTAMSSVGSFVNENILPQSKEATAPSTSSAPISSPPAAAPSRPSATPSAAPAAASAPPTIAPTPPANASAPPAPSPAASAPPPTAPAGPPVSTPPRNARGEPPSRSATNSGAAREDRYRYSGRDAPSEKNRPRAFEDMTSERMRRRSRMAGPCTGGIGGCYWGGGQY